MSTVPFTPQEMMSMNAPHAWFSVVARRLVVRQVVAIGAVIGGLVGSARLAVGQERLSSSAIRVLAASAKSKRDSMTGTIEPLARIEVKLVMWKGAKAEYSWRADSSEVTYNLHAEGPDAPGGKAFSYGRGASRGEKGEIVAAFDGVHGWSWRNTSERPVRVTVVAWGQFQELKKM